jgi:hypothetical protein
MAAEVPVEDLRYKMIMALNAADIGNPICEQAAEICAEIAEQHCAELHVTTDRAAGRGRPAGSERPGARAHMSRTPTARPQERP